MEVRQNCGNGVVEEGEECDCGSIQECPTLDPCCDAITCKLIKEAQCASGACCEKCFVSKSDLDILLNNKKKLFSFPENFYLSNLD